MILILTLDDRDGMCFNHRRQSRDRVLNDYMLRLTGDRTLWMNAYSGKLFPDAVTDGKVKISEEFLTLCGEGEFAFAEDVDVGDALSRAERVLVFRWNRVYPFDLVADLSRAGANRQVLDEFPGSSHEKITLEEYTE